MNYPPAASLDSLFEQFLKERTYLKNVMPRTLVWYRTAFKNHRAVLDGAASVWPTNTALQQFTYRCANTAFDLSAATRTSAR